MAKVKVRMKVRISKKCASPPTMQLRYGIAGHGLNNPPAFKGKKFIANTKAATKVLKLYTTSHPNMLTNQLSK
jgi:hypothetical protein